MNRHLKTGQSTVARMIAEIKTRGEVAVRDLTFATGCAVSVDGDRPLR